MEPASAPRDLPPLLYAPFASDPDPATAHLRACAECRSWTLGRLLGIFGDDSPLPGDAALPHEYDAVFRRVRARLPQLVREVERRRREAVPLLAELQSLSAGERRRAIEHPRFRNPALVELLLTASAAGEPREPAEAMATARLAATLAGRLAHTPDGLAETFACALYLEANAWRLLGDFPGAERALERAVPFLFHAADWGIHCRGLGLLRWEEGRLHEAALCLEHAATFFNQEEDLGEQGACRALLGLLLVEEEAYAAALPVLRQALPALAPERRPWLRARTGMALALTFAETGRARAAQKTRAGAWRDYRRLNRNEDDLLPLHWLGGQLAARLGERDAQPLLETVWRECLERNRLAEAALVMLDLGDLGRGLREPGRAAEWDERIARLGEAATKREELRPVLDALREAAEDRPGARSALRRVLRARGPRLAPLPFV
jgi:tetratricopeptide (TPR) repeat protein